MLTELIQVKIFQYNNNRYHKDADENTSEVAASYQWDVYATKSASNQMATSLADR